MTPPHKDYQLTYQECAVKGKRFLRAILHTHEFGDMESRAVDAVDDHNVRQQLLNTLADDVIDEYERRLSQRPIVVAGWE